MLAAARSAEGVRGAAGEGRKEARRSNPASGPAFLRRRARACAGSQPPPELGRQAPASPPSSVPPGRSRYSGHGNWGGRRADLWHRRWLFVLPDGRSAGPARGLLPDVKRRLPSFPRFNGSYNRIVGLKLSGFLPGDTM